jgi:hypothetical protein
MEMSDNLHALFTLGKEHQVPNGQGAWQAPELVKTLQKRKSLAPAGIRNPISRLSSLSIVTMPNELPRFKTRQIKP